jgi:hypothetical protein
MTSSQSNRNPAALGGPIAAATFVGGLVAGNALSNAPYPRPGASPDAIRRYFSDNRGPARLSITGQLLSATALGVFAASVVKLARRAGRGSRPLQLAAAAGGGLSFATLTASALTSLELTRGAADQPESAMKLGRRVFVAGGPMHGPAIGLLMGALGVAGLRTKALPKWLSWFALGTAAAGLLAPASLKVERAVLLVPASRFPGLLISGIAGWKLSRQAM